MQPHIYLDMDGVMVDFVGKVLRTFPAPLEPKDITGWNIEDQLGIPREDFWRRLDSHAWWRTLSPYPWSTPLFEMLTAYGQVTYLSSPSNRADVAEGKVDWIHDRHGKGFDDWILTSHKDRVAAPGRILIDDSERNCAAWERAGGCAILFPQYWNKDRPWRKLHDGLNLSDGLAVTVGDIENQLKKALS